MAIKHYGWKGRKGRKKQQRAVRRRSSVRVREARANDMWFMGYTGRLRRRGFSLPYVIQFYHTIDGVEYPSSKEISIWYKTRWRIPGIHRASPVIASPPSTPDTLIPDSGNESHEDSSSGGEGRAPFQSPPFAIIPKRCDNDSDEY